MAKIGEIHDKLTKTEFADVPDQFKSLYVEQGGEYVYKDPKAAIEGMRRAKEERGAIQEELDTLKAKYKDVDPARFAELVQLEKDFKEMDSSNKGELDRIKKELRDQYEGTTTELKRKLGESNNRYANRILNGEITGELRKAGVTEKGAELLRGNIFQNIQTRWNDDEPEFIVIDPRTNKGRLNKDADPMTIADLVAEAKNDHPQLFSSLGAGGGGSGGDSGGAPPADGDPRDWSDQQKKAYIKANGHEQFRKLLTKYSAPARKTA